jgi:hypothetical protein
LRRSSPVFCKLKKYQNMKTKISLAALAAIVLTVVGIATAAPREQAAPGCCTPGAQCCDGGACCK